MKMKSNITRASALSCRHVDLGAKFGEYIRMAAPLEYSTDGRDEHTAVRETAGLFDLTPFLKFFVKGPDATAVMDHAATRDMTKVKPGQAVYTLFLRDNGTICDDGLVFKLDDNEYMIVHGDGCARKMSEESAKGKDATVEYDEGLQLLSLQGPKALELLNQHTPSDLSAIKYFGHQETELFGRPCFIARCGYSGERGYEIYLNPEDACEVWDNILSYGKELGIIPCSLSTIFTLRLEAGLLWRRFDLMEHTPWEVRSGWTVSRNKGDFRGKEATLAAEGKERYMTCGIVADIDQKLAGGEKLMLDGKEVGVVNGNPAYSHRMKKSLAWARVQPELATVGTKLEVVGEGMSCTATVEEFPVYDVKTRG